MRIAVLLHGNLRTFFMPLRENSAIRVCDLIFSNIIKHNNADVFLVTDTTDFYHDGIQYFDRRMEVDSRSGNYNYIDSEKAKCLLTDKLNKFFGGFVKEIEIQEPIDISLDPKIIFLSQYSYGDCIPEGGRCSIKSLVQQYRKIKRAYLLLQKYEQKSLIHYDVIFRGRFDNIIDNPLDICSYDFEKNDVFVPGIFDSGIVYDWAAFGKKLAMEPLLCLYDKLGFTLSEKRFRCECIKCGSQTCGEKIPCKCGGKMRYFDYTLSSEYHIYKTLKDHNIKFACGCPMSPYRYK